MILHHPKEMCDSRVHCPFHDPSDHIMRDWPIQLRESGLIERVCMHGIAHPDPDSVAYFALTQDEPGAHGCDGCCTKKQKPPSRAQERALKRSLLKMQKKLGA